MRSNPENQRGAKLSLPQRQSRIDSVFRLYPGPPMFLRETTTRGLKGDPSVYGSSMASSRLSHCRILSRDSSSIPTDRTDEVRDQFIRLQAGAALMWQEVRDAWPGNLGPFVVRLAGK
jgi:hypothetical protein